MEAPEADKIQFVSAQNAGNGFLAFPPPPQDYKLSYAYALSNE